MKYNPMYAYAIDILITERSRLLIQNTKAIGNMFKRANIISIKQLNATIRKLKSLPN